MSALLKACARGGVASLLFISAVSVGQARVDTRTLTCAQVEAMLNRERSVVLYSGPQIFDRYVPPDAACGGLEIPKPRLVPTSDGQCGVYTCELRVQPGSR